ncbi:hypothetical protein RJT34_24363 [Clitoria ternatea]|uniref:BHLH domain-containing protein n=1 Tax=Clitoria ternatea TaxID=43366 RepID=A0AAN9FTZ4_CLITE
MGGFSPEKLLGEIFWDEPLSASNMQTEPFPPTTQSAFVQYRDLPGINSHLKVSMSKKMLAFLGKNWPVERNECERDRGFRHMINERLRRHRQRQCCLALHSILPLGTKVDNNSVIQMAAKEIVRLQGCREELERRNCVLEAKLEGNHVQYLRVPYPTSGIDSMVETLKCLKGHGVDTRSIKSTFSSHELFAALELETKVADADVERAIWRPLDGVECEVHSDVVQVSKKQKTDIER